MDDSPLNNKFIVAAVVASIVLLVWAAVTGSADFGKGAAVEDVFLIDTALLGEWHGISPLTYTRLDFLAGGVVVVTRLDGSSDNARWYVTSSEKGQSRLCIEMRSGTKDCASYQLEDGGYYGYVSFDGGVYSRP